LLQLSTDFPKRVVIGKICQLPAKFSDRMTIRKGYAAEFPERMIGIRQPFEVLGDPLRRLGQTNIFVCSTARP